MHRAGRGPDPAHFQLRPGAGGEVDNDALVCFSRWLLIKDDWNRGSAGRSTDTTAVRQSAIFRFDSWASGTVGFARIAPAQHPCCSRSMSAKSCSRARSSRPRAISSSATLTASRSSLQSLHSDRDVLVSGPMPTDIGVGDLLEIPGETDVNVPQPISTNPRSAEFDSRRLHQNSGS